MPLWTRRELGARGLALLGLLALPRRALAGAATDEVEPPGARAAAEGLLAELDRGEPRGIEVRRSADRFRITAARAEGVLVLTGAAGEVATVAFLAAGRRRRRHDAVARRPGGTERVASSDLAARRIAPRRRPGSALPPVYRALARRLLAVERH